MLSRLQSLDKSVVYLILAAGIVGVLLRPIGLPIRITSETKTVYDTLDSLQRGAVLVLSFDYGASNVPELHPAAIAMLKHAFSRDLRVVTVALSVEGANWAADALGQVLPQYPGKTYGVDYVNLGYKPGGQVFLEKLGSNVIEACAGVDSYGKSLAGMHIMDAFKSAKDIALAASLTAGEPGYPQWISIIGSTYGVPVTAATIAPGVPAAIPLVKSGHLKGVIKGMRGAAEYELLIGQKGQAVSGMDALSLGQLIIVLFIIAGNVGYFASKERGGHRG